MKRVLIIGSGPAGASLAILLKKAGIDVTIIDRGIRPELVVGESLIPSVVERLRALGLEQQIATFGRHKPGAAICMPGHFDWSIDFQQPDIEHNWPSYAYNVPRKQFDQLLLDAARESGCQIVLGRAELKLEHNGEVSLNSPDLGDFDLIVDASGRSRIIAKLCKLTALRGKRDDLAIFSHFDRAELPYGGSIHMLVFEHGWSWRIPLKDRVSVGFVVSRDKVESYGFNPEEQYSTLINANPVLKEALKGANQIEDIYRYQNYQLVSDRMFGTNWVLLGDAAGFVDPVFSSGLSLAFDGAFLLAESLINNSGLQRYQYEYQKRIRFWQRLVDTFYDSRFLNMIKVGTLLRQRAPQIIQQLNIYPVLIAMISGLAVRQEGCFEESFYKLMQNAVDSINPNDRVGPIV